MVELKKNIPVQNFFCIGAQKAGTTTLAEILNQHSQIFLPAVKETKFFLFEDDFNKGIDFYNATYFSNYKGEKISGEFDPDYIMEGKVAERLFNTYGANLKFLVIFRHPVDRAYSHYLMTKRKGLEDLSFEDALKKEVGRKSNFKEQKVFAYKTRSLYAEHLRNYFKFFPRENFLFLVFEEDIKKQLPETIRRIEDFLQIEHQELPTDVHSNQAFEAKNEMVRDLVRRPNFVKQIFKTLIPGKSTRKKLRDFFIKQNAKTVKSPKLDLEIRHKLFTEYFSNDILATEDLIQKKLNY
ncbi:MAG: sulfotransferase domain-containing protein [Bacteroidetes bacterium]|nr:sulfotransferase domain-containing protein [Bacteroidota bacterium]MBP7398281.1 sulfotransferase domain-containing protein [Chitinophagales bacterium]MBK7108722.1 sulfotransferase domain-containing protein [Bacteroidota bacterium]MBK8488951.1 sulfotransferase domain-containing protein [Bacteroidota bacterium]MBP8753603.1 sulfotransferase domain-containing protein [Chitinophagales bacterium]